MAGLVDINWRPGPRELRSFGVAMIVGFAVLAGLWWFFKETTTVPLVMVSVGGVAGALGLTGTKIALPIYWVWMGIAFVLGNIMSRVLVAALYFGLFTPMGLFMRLIRRDKLQLRNTRASYWSDLPPAPTDPKRYERQF